MTLRRLTEMYEHYKNHYDFTLSRKTYSDIEYELEHEGEFFPD